MSDNNFYKIKSQQMMKITTYLNKNNYICYFQDKLLTYLNHLYWDNNNFDRTGK